MTSPLTAFIIWLLKSPRSRADAGQHARSLNIRLDYPTFLHHPSPAPVG